MSSAKPQIKRTYGSRGARPALISSGSSDTSPSSSPARETTSTKLSSTLSNKRKRPLSDLLHPNVAPPPKKQQRGKPAVKKTTTLTQLHFITDTPILRTCPLCDLTYTRGAPDDEALHKSHCARVQRGFEWGKEDERDKSRTNVVEVQSHVRLSSGEVGRIVSVPVTCGGKLGQKVRKMSALERSARTDLESSCRPICKPSTPFSLPLP
jgi:N-acetyltransferase